MKVCFCISEMNSGGAERAVANIANALANRNMDITIFLLSVTTPSSFYKLNKKITLATLQKTNKFRILTKIKKISEFFIRNEFDIIISFLANPIIYTYLASKKTKIKYICSERSNPKKYSVLKRILLKKAFKNADGSVFQTQKALKYYQNKGVVIYNPINININNKQCNKKNDICFIGSYRRVKNFDLLFKSFKEFNYSKKNYSLRIFGVDKNNKSCIKKINKYGLQKYVVLEGKTKNIEKEIASSSLFVSTSFYEGMSNAVLEAASLGVPCVVTNCEIGGNEEIAKYYKNVFLSSFNYKEFSKNMINHVSKFSIKKIEKPFTITYVANKWIEYINNIFYK